MKKICFTALNLVSVLRKRRHEVFCNDVHMREAMNWLLRAKNMTCNNGVSEGFHIFHGWLPAYPETTGYLIETFLDYYYYTKDSFYRECAVQMADWLVSIQYEDGSFPDSYFRRKLVFDTGQILLGLVRAYEETKDEVYKEAGIKAGSWLIGVQEDDGSWLKHAYNKIAHSYYSRVAWSLLCLWKIHAHERYLVACKRNIEWVLDNQCDSGWFDRASFTLENHHKPFTHTIAYTVRGVLECGVSLQEERYLRSVIMAMDNLLKVIPSNGFVCGTYRQYWEGNNKFCCLTGSAQLAIIFFKLAKLFNSEKYSDKGCQINQYLKSKQDIEMNNANIRGGIAGSYPMWGKYIHFSYPNWAAKFFVDSLLLENSFS